MEELWQKKRDVIREKETWAKTKTAEENENAEAIWWENRGRKARREEAGEGGRREGRKGGRKVGYVIRKCIFSPILSYCHTYEKLRPN